MLKEKERVIWRSIGESEGKKKNKEQQPIAKSLWRGCQHLTSLAIRLEFPSQAVSLNHSPATSSLYGQLYRQSKYFLDEKANLGSTLPFFDREREKGWNWRQDWWTVMWQKWKTICQKADSPQTATLEWLSYSVYWANCI